MPLESVLAHIATAKYYDHLPLHRQLDIFEREGIHLSPSTVSNWMISCARRLETIYNELRELVGTAITSWPMDTPSPKATGPVLFTAGICGTYLPRFHTFFLNITRAVAAAE